MMGFDIYDLKVLVEAVYQALHTENEKILSEIKALNEKLNEPMNVVDRLKAQPVIKRMEQKGKETLEEEKVLARMREKAKQSSFLEKKRQSVHEEEVNNYEDQDDGDEELEDDDVDEKIDA